jgi:hypothetical protein
MTQALYAHMNNKKKKSCLLPRKPRESGQQPPGKKW